MITYETDWFLRDPYPRKLTVFLPFKMKLRFYGTRARKVYLFLKLLDF